MGSFKINGGKSLKGIIHPQGAKNEALQILEKLYNNYKNNSLLLNNKSLKLSKYKGYLHKF